MLSPGEAAALAKGEALKRVVRAAAALKEIYDDTKLGEALNKNRGAVGAWWTGVQMKPDTLRRLAEVTDLSFEELTRFVYLDGPPPTLPAPSGPSGLREGIRRAEEHPDDEGPGRRAQSPGQPPPDDGAGLG